MYCNQCGKEVTQDQKFCSNCGAAIAADQKLPGSQPAQPIQAQIVTKKDVFKIVMATIFAFIVVFYIVDFLSKLISPKPKENKVAGYEVFK